MNILAKTPGLYLVPELRNVKYILYIHIYNIYIPQGVLGGDFPKTPYLYLVPELRNVKYIYINDHWDKWLLGNVT